MPTLVITINGPFAYDDIKRTSGHITLMAPMCPQHLAGIASIEANNQYVLPRTNFRNHKGNQSDCYEHLYTLALGLTTPPSKVAWKGKFLLRPNPSHKFKPKDWRFWLKLPRPNSFVEINPVAAEIIGPKTGAVSSGPYAIGVRLIYDNWDGGNIPVLYKGGNPKDPAPSPFSFTFSKIGNDFSFLEIDYASPLRDDPFHEDAVECFENLMHALRLNWSMYVPNPRPGPEISKLNDCKSAIAWID